MRSRAVEAPLAFAAGMSAGAVVLHYALWPWRLRPLPYLVHAEGLRGRDLPAYNGILWACDKPAEAYLKPFDPAKTKFRWEQPAAPKGPTDAPMQLPKKKG